MAEIIRQAINDRLASVHVMLPGKVESYDAATQKADIQPMISRLQKTVDGEIKEDLPVIPSVPVAFPRAGGFKITMPVKEGDRCMLVFCERSIDVYQQSSGSRPVDPDLFLMHDLSDAVALMGWYPDSGAAESTDGSDMVLGKDGGEVIHIGNDQINLYEKSAADFVALAHKVLDELTVAKDNVTAATNWANQGFANISTTVPVPNDGGAAIITGLVAWLASTPAPTPTSPSSVAAEKVKAT